jgi:importin-7
VEDEDDVDEESDIDEELGYLSPLDNVNPYVSFKQALTSTPCSLLLIPALTIYPTPRTALQVQNAACYQASTASLSVEQQTLLMEVMQRASQTQDGIVQA